MVLLEEKKIINGSELLLFKRVFRCLEKLEQNWSLTITKSTCHIRQCLNINLNLQFTIGMQYLLKGYFLNCGGFGG